MFDDLEPINFDNLVEEEQNQDPIQSENQEINDQQEKNDEEQEEVNNPEEDNLPDYSDNSLFQFLQERGVRDPKKIVFTNEDNTTEEVDFNNLSVEEQLELIRQVADPGLTQDEINTINYLRQNRVTFNQAIDYWAKKRLDDYLKENPNAEHKKVYSVDDYTNDDLFLIDLKSRYPDFTDEELMDELNAAKSNEELFEKKADLLRKAFKEAEDQEVAEKEQSAQRELEDWRNNIKIAAGKFNEIQLDYTDEKSDSLVIDDEDKQQMMSYIFDQDAEGQSALMRALQDPDSLIELAWFATQGPKVLSELSQYWKKQLAQERSEKKKLQAKLDKISSGTIVQKTDSVVKKSGSSVWDDSDLL